jgi:hypothetical protein
MDNLKSKLNLNHLKQRIYPVDDDILIKTEPLFNKQLTEITLEEKKNPEFRKRITLNAQGRRFEVLTRVLSKYPATRLGKLSSLLDEQDKDSYDALLDLCDDFDITKNEFYFSRDDKVVRSVLNYFENGHLHYPSDLCVKLFDDELKFWGLDERLVDDCCQGNYTSKKGDFEEEIEAKKKVLNELYHKEDFSSFFCCKIPRYLAVLRERIWHVFDKPFESYIGMVLHLKLILLLCFQAFFYLCY